ncbi:hypothetical protein Ciccas_014572, partial [Cichlidogyrus casuarinus]
MWNRIALLKELWSEYWRFLFLIIYAIALGIPCGLVGTDLARGAFCFLYMAGLWIFDVIPIHITALLPIVLAPLLGLVPSDEICKAYSG